ncbi:ATP-binding protein [Falsiroseomonas sp. E2-1-a20]|uniref:ATP-binding protein n=1 Tax=Falsiroseomonas sp. E2-1-a20 TaxID=3239300 RepID=UPI003F336554
MNALSPKLMRIRLASVETDNQTLREAVDAATASSRVLETAVASLRTQISSGQAELIASASALASAQEETKIGQYNLLISIAALASSQEETKDSQNRFLAGAAALELSQNETKDGLRNLLTSAAALASSRAEMNVILENSAIGMAALETSRAETKVGRSDLLASAVANRALSNANDLLVSQEAALEKSVERSTAALNTEIEERHRAEDALRQSQKMEAVGQLTGGLAHDFNNMLQVITGSLGLLELALVRGFPADASRHIANALNAAASAATITHRLLAFSRQQVLDSQPTDANALIASMHDLVQRTVGPEIEFVVVQTPNIWPLLCDKNQMENALLNLCINARDALPCGGKITVQSANVGISEQVAQAQGVQAGDYVSLTVTDTGKGMSHEVAMRAFDPFFTTKQVGEGTGLGLSMVYGFAKQSGGFAQIQSEINAGTKVQIFLPRLVGQAREKLAIAEAVELQSVGDGKVILVVDDEEAARTQITEFLNFNGFSTIEASDGAAALGLIESVQKIDLMISDIGIPGGMDGRQMADIACCLRPELKVLFITGYAKRAFTENGQLPHGAQVLAKPFSLRDMAVKVTGMTSVVLAED